MSKIYNFEDHEDVYLVILKYYKGDPLLLNKENIKELSTGKFNGETINPIDIEILKELKKIFKSLKKYTFTYPKWSKTQIKEKLDKMFPEIKDKSPSSSSHKTISKKEDYKYILEQRKSYVDWINNEYYDKIITESDDPIIKNNYQLFVKGYLSLESPFRGLLVYHGLGTGKTATSVITAEGLSTMKINTFLPASLEGNYIGEIKTFATDTFNIDRNNWVFYPMSEINKDDHIRNHADLTPSEWTDEHLYCVALLFLTPDSYINDATDCGFVVNDGPDTNTLIVHNKFNRLILMDARCYHEPVVPTDNFQRLTLYAGYTKSPLLKKKDFIREKLLIENGVVPGTNYTFDINDYVYMD